MRDHEVGFEPAEPPVVDLGMLPGQMEVEPTKVIQIQDSQPLPDSTPCSPTSNTGATSFGTGSRTGKSLVLNPEARGKYLPVPTDVMWQWDHRKGFRDYTPSQNAKIEYAFQRGDSTVHLKTGKAGTTPMQIFFTDMLQYDVMSGNSRSVRRVGNNSCFMRARRFVMEFVRSFETGQPRKQTFRKYQTRQAALEVQEEAFDVTTLYGAGCCARIARSFTFSLLTTALVFINVIWIGVDVDWNTASTIEDAALEFQVMEYIFCFFFSLELLIRLLAFRRMRDFIRDAWFCFDVLLVFLMFLETLLFRFIRMAMTTSDQESGGTFKNVTILRMARLLKLTRMTRLLRALPELMTMLRGIATALRSVIFTLVLQLLLLYIFGIFFCTWTNGHNLTTLDEYFSSLAQSMFTLLVYGTFMDGPSAPLTSMIDAGTPTLFSLFLFFIILSSFTVLNMLVGILFQVVADVSEAETLKNETYYLRYNLLDILECYDKDGDQTIGKEEFKVLMKNPEVHEILGKFGTDVQDLTTLADVLFEDMTAESDQGKLSFEELLQVVLRLRGARSASVTDIVQLREYLRQTMEALGKELKVGQMSILQGVGGVTQPAAIPATVVLHLTHDGHERSQIRRSSLSIAELVQQVSQHGRLVAVNRAGLEIGPELTLGEVAAHDDGEVHLRLLPENPL
mmetsp:Transcript_67390/g.197026  ORF Transcript_67390/g.197026 Transcript_67390/m.197026 type:complete len:679 (-) Transcript_67390:178-2214(-)